MGEFFLFVSPLEIYRDCLVLRTADRTGGGVCFALRCCIHPPVAFELARPRGVLLGRLFRGDVFT